MLYRSNGEFYATSGKIAKAVPRLPTSAILKIRLRENLAFETSAGIELIREITRKFANEPIFSCDFA